MTFEDIALECIKTPELIKKFNRLTGCKLGVDTRSIITIMIDKATGYQDEIDKQEEKEMFRFLDFVFEAVWLPLIIEAKLNRKESV